MKLWRWQRGRQSDHEYYKFPLWYFTIGKWGFDAYILKYSKEGTLPKHKDVIPNAEHHRLNIRLTGDATFFMDGKVVHKRIICFRPDIHSHSLWVKSPTLKLSFGLVKFK